MRIISILQTNCIVISDSVLESVKHSITILSLFPLTAPQTFLERVSMIPITFSKEFPPKEGYQAHVGSSSRISWEEHFAPRSSSSSFSTTGSQQRAAPGSCWSSGVSEKHGDRSEDPVHSYAAWWKVSYAWPSCLVARTGLWWGLETFGFRETSVQILIWPLNLEQ